MATSKQTREIMRKLYRAQEEYRNRLIDAGNAGIIRYDNTKYAEESPMSTLYKTMDRVDKTTQEALANAMKSEIKEMSRG